MRKITIAIIALSALAASTAAGQDFGDPAADLGADTGGDVGGDTGDGMGGDTGTDTGGEELPPAYGSSGTDVPAPVAPAAAATADASTEDLADKPGALGVGGSFIPGGGAALHLRYYLSSDFGLMFNVGMLIGSTTTTPPMMGPESSTSATTLTFQAAGTYKIQPWSDGHLSLLGGLDLTTTSTSSEVGGMAGADGSLLSIGLTAGFMGEFFLADFLSLFGMAGLRFGIASGENPPGYRFPVAGDLSAIQIGAGGSLLTAFGATFWLD